MKQTVVQLLVGLLGLFVLVWGEVKHYVESHPEIITSFQLESKKAEPIRYYNYQVAYDPNNNKLWYYYGDGNWYDRPPEIRQTKVEKQKTTISTGGTTGSFDRYSSQASAFTQRY